MNRHQPLVRLRRTDDTPSGDEFENIRMEEPPPDPPETDRRPIILAIVAVVVGLILLATCLVIYSLTRGATATGRGTATVEATATEAESITGTAVETAAATEDTSTTSLAPLASATVAATETPARTATLSEIIGQVQVRTAPDAAWSAAEEGAALAPGTTILTGQDSRAKVTLPEGNVIRLSSQTQFTLAELSGTDSDPVDRTQLDFGKVWAIVSGGSGVFEIQLPVGVAAVRGTFLSAEYNSTTNGIVVSCLEGNCHYENTNGAVDFTTQQQAIAVNGAAPRVEAISANQLNDWNVQNIPEVQTLTPTPSETLVPSETPVATSSNTPAPTLTPVPTRTPRPTRTPTNTRTPRPTSTITATPAPTATSGPAVQLAFITQPPASVSGGISFQVQVAVQDANGATARDALEQVSLSIGTNGGGGTLGGITTVTPANGVATFNISVDKGGQYTLVASAPGLTSTISTTFNIETSKAQGFFINGLANDVSAGQPVSVIVTAYDPDGSVSQNYLGTVQFQSSDDQAVLPTAYTFTPGDQGSHSFTITFKTTGSQSLKVVDTQKPSLAGYAGTNVK